LHLYGFRQARRRLYLQTQSIYQATASKSGQNRKKKLTTCRLKKRVRSKSGQMVCIYVGNNKTYEMMIESWCPKQYKCVYNPWGKEPNIDDVINSLNNAVK
jgi:hypothetical protein